MTPEMRDAAAAAMKWFDARMATAGEPPMLGVMPKASRVSTGKYDVRLTGSARRRIASAMRQATRMGIPLDWWDLTETVHALVRRARTGIGSGVVRAPVLLPS